MNKRDFSYHRERLPAKKIIDSSKEQRNRESLRCGCKAIVRIKLKKSCDIFPEEWQVIQFISHHNHKLLSHEEVRFLTSYRNISKEDKQILLLRKASLLVRQIMREMELDKNLSFADATVVK